ncbi:Sodium-dependent dicarboxylate transporter SdcS [Polystyrenella longa]|uniref:Sodium-dependent dicarboxylate transporter SdcS n=1 Tax=Polystyrenella longa TaxID=2528007 RepID=A0A518CME2_9PLAN|nr:DASS family sodium-coupled anion symporter [Polystyrenella longa]QDU80400.1 Sodium-dependent dicarboxylate transporter SdcS [Polystyrenella longa]
MPYSPNDPQIRHEVAGSIFRMLEIKSPHKVWIFLFCLLLSTTIAYIVPDSTDLEPAARRALFILLFAGSLWVSDAIPAFAVGILIIGLQIALLGQPGDVYAETPRDWEEFVKVLGHPLIWLFFGGFVLAAGMSKTSLDYLLANKLILRKNTTPLSLMLSVLGATFLLSMFISNTATSAMILAMLRPVWSKSHTGNYVTGLVLVVSLGANLGGMGSLIGTPPNAIAVGSLQELEPAISISFLHWMMYGLPPALLLIFLLTFYLKKQYLTGDVSINQILEQMTVPRMTGTSTDTDHEIHHIARWQRLTVSGTCLITILLWMTGQWHGLPTAVVSFIPIVVFTTTGVLTARDVRSLQYDVLFLLAGGLALGQTITMTGLSGWMVEHLPTDSISSFWLILLLGYTTVLFSNFMSNTAGANILIPLGVSLNPDMQLETAVVIALCASAAMCLPVATPPNAMVYATEKCGSRDFLKLGLILGLIAPPICAAWVTLLGMIF